MSVLAFIFSIISVFFGLFFLIDCVRCRKQIYAHVKCGMACGLILVIIELSMLPFIPNISSTMPIPLLIAVDSVAFVRITLFVCMGMYCCSVLRIRSFYWPRIIQGQKKWSSVFNKSYFVLVPATVLLAVGYSVVLFKATSPHLSESLARLSEIHAARFGITGKPSLLVTMGVLEFAFAEEFIFRLGIQNFIAKHLTLARDRYWVAILCTAVFWTLAHANTLDPEWVKLAQVFPLGLALGFLFRKYGIETCILVHGAFNVAMMFLAAQLFTGQ